MKNISSILTLALIVLLMGACGSSQSTEEKKISPEVVSNPATADPDAGPSNTALPVFKFEKENHEFGEIVEGEKVTYTFKFTNVGNAPLVISSANASCGCTVPEYTKSAVQPGEQGEVNVTYNSEGRSGMNAKTITLIANTEPNTKVLKISADVQSKQSKK